MVLLHRPAQEMHGPALLVLRPAGGGMKGEKEDAKFAKHIHLFPSPLQVSDRPGCEWCVWVVAPDICGDRAKPWVLKTRSGSCWKHQNKALPPNPDLLSI